MARLRTVISKIKKILSESLFPLLGIGSIARRKKASFKYLSGKGIEIGALHYPTKVRKTVSVKYVDVFSYEDAVKKFPEINSYKIVKPDYIDDGFTLGTLPNQEQDFVIANHVLEHSPNPIGTLVNWARVLKVDGLIYFSVPLASKCFDNGREITSVQHLIEDFKLNNTGNLEEFESRNKSHYKEWITISEMNMLSMRDAPQPEITEEYVNDRIQFFSKNKSEIHFHTFSVESVEAFVEEIDQSVNCLRAIDVIESKAEVIVILQKCE